MMRIAYVINSVEGGGAAFPVPAVISALRDRGATVELFALTRRDGRALAPVRAAGIPATVRNGGERDHLPAMYWLDQQISRFAPDLIWTSLTRATLLGQLVGRRRRVPVVSWQHAEYLKPANLKLLKAMQRLSRLWIADSESIADLTARRLGIERERLAVWPLFAADPGATQRREWVPGEAVRIGSLGRLHMVKGYDVLIEALGILGNRCGPAVQVSLAGDGGERRNLELLASAKGVTIDFVGFQPDPREFLARQHLYVQPSRGEGLCIAAHEAMQAGLPVIASAVGEMPRTIIDGVTGYVVPPGDPVTLADALARALADPGSFAAMGAQSRARVLGQFGPVAFADACDAVFARLPVSRREASAVHRAASPGPSDLPASHRPA